MPYITLWDKISHNSALLKADFHKNFKSHRIFRPSQHTFYKEIIINHTLLYLSQVSYIKIKVFLFFLGEFQNDFCENLTKLYQISSWLSTVYGMYVQWGFMSEPLSLFKLRSLWRLNGYSVWLEPSLYHTWNRWRFKPNVHICMKFHARLMIHIKYQTLFGFLKKPQNLKCPSWQILSGAVIFAQLYGPCHL